MPHVLAALVNLDHPGHYLHWGFIQISLANLLVIILMAVTFVLALLLPFPHSNASTTTTPVTPATKTVDEQVSDRTEP
jgi:hypothetical protein